MYGLTLPEASDKMKINKILLIMPPAFTFKAYRDINPLPPMGLGYLASVAEKAGIEVKILDCLIRGWDHEEEASDTLIRVGLSDKEIKDFMSDFNPDMVGINCSFSRQHKLYHHLMGLIKEADPKCVTVAGGAHTTVCPEDILGDPACDFILTGEAEESFGNLLSLLNSGADISSIDGLGWKKGTETVINRKNRWIEDLDAINFPAYHIMELERYFALDVSHGLRHKNKFCPIITSRGCPAKCTFCSADKVWGRKYRMRSVDNIIKEMKLLKERYGVEELMFEDDNVTADPKRAKELFSTMVKEGLNFTWDTPNGVGIWSVDEPMIDLMKASGCTRLNFPVESGSQRVLNEVIRKPLNLSKAKSLIAYCKKIKLDHGMFLVIGMPGETIPDIWQSFRFAAACGVYDPHISIATPYPGTQLLEICREEGLLKSEYSLDDLFIRSFMIKTKFWGGDELERLLLKGGLYLKFMEMFYDPGNFFRWLIRRMSTPKRFLYHLKKVAGLSKKS